VAGTVEPLLRLTEGLQGALAASDGAAVVALLKENPRLSQVPNGYDGEWSTYTDLLVRLAEARLPGTTHYIQNAVSNLNWLGAHSDFETRQRRTVKLLAAADQFISDNETALITHIDNIRGGCVPYLAVLAWLEKIGRREIHPHVPRDMAAAVKLAYLATPRPNPKPPFLDWDAAWPILTAKLHGEHGYVRSYAARLLGEWYRESQDLVYNELDLEDRVPMQPGLKIMLDHVTTLEVASPGIAGPFLTAFSVCDAFEGWKKAGVDPVEWVLYLIENRRGYEPQDYSHSLSINFHAHEMLVSEEHLIRLVRAGCIEIAAESAKDSGTDFRVVLNQMQDESTPITREIAAYMLCEYGELPLDLAGKSGVCHREASDGIERIFVVPIEKNLDASHWLFIRPESKDCLVGDAAAWAVIDAIVPVNGRGAIKNKMRFEKPLRTWLEFENGIYVNFFGPGEQDGWLRVSLASNIPFEFWKTRNIPAADTETEIVQQN